MESIDVHKEGKEVNGHWKLSELGLEEGHIIEISAPEERQVTQNMKEE